MTPLPTFEEVQAKARDHQELREMVWQLLAPGQAFMTWRVSAWMKWMSAGHPGLDRETWERRILCMGTQAAVEATMRSVEGDTACLAWALQTARDAQRIGCCDTCSQWMERPDGERACVHGHDLQDDPEAPLLNEPTRRPQTDCQHWEPCP